MDSSLSRQTISSLSIIPGQPLHRLTESVQQGNICGRYVDASGIAHGFIARVTGTSVGKCDWHGTAAPLNPPSLVTPLNPSPSAWGGAIPAR